MGIDIVNEPDPKKTSAITYGGALIKGKETLSLELDEAKSRIFSPHIHMRVAERPMQATGAIHQVFRCFTVTRVIRGNDKTQSRIGRCIKESTQRRTSAKNGKVGLGCQGSSAAENTPRVFVTRIVGPNSASRNCHTLFKMLNKYVSELESRSTNGHYGERTQIFMMP